jgi:DNA polymerase III delta prime subunit
MFFKDKYKPIFFDDYSIYKNITYKLKNLIESGDISNIIFYGKDGSGKYTMARCFINEIFKRKIEIEKKIIKIKINNSLKEIEIMGSQYHFEIDIIKYNALLNNRVNLINIIKLLVSFKEISGECDYKIILIKNIHNINHPILYIKNFIEKYHTNVRFIFTSARITNNLKDIQSFFTLISLSQLDIDQYIILSNKILIEENRKISKTKIKEIIGHNPILENILIKLEIICNNKGKYIDPIDSSINELYNMIITKKIGNILKIRELLYKLISKNFDIKMIIQKLYMKIIYNKKITDENKIIITRIFSIYESRIYKSYKDLIHLEALLISILNII